MKTHKTLAAFTPVFILLVTVLAMSVPTVYAIDRITPPQSYNNLTATDYGGASPRTFILDVRTMWEVICTDGSRARGSPIWRDANGTRRIPLWFDKTSYDNGGAVGNAAFNGFINDLLASGVITKDDKIISMCQGAVRTDWSVGRLEALGFTDVPEMCPSFKNDAGQGCPDSNNGWMYQYSYDCAKAPYVSFYYGAGPLSTAGYSSDYYQIPPLPNANLSNNTVTFSAHVWHIVNETYPCSDDNDPQYDCTPGTGNQTMSNGIENVTLWIWYENGTLFYNETNTSGVNTVWGKDAFYNFTVYNIPDGTYKWNMQAYDKSDPPNVGWGYFGYGNKTVTVDTIPPYNVTMLAPANNTNTTSNTVTFNFTARDGLLYALNYSVYIDGEVNYTGNISNGTINSTTINVLEGVHNWTVHVSDTAGNTNTSAPTWYFTVDTTEPYNVSMLSPANNTYTNNPNVTFNFTALDALTNVMNFSVYIDGVVNYTGNITNGTINSTTINVPEGVHNWTVHMSDLLDNTNDTAPIFYFIVDTTPSNITIQSPENRTYGTGYIDYNITVSEALNWAKVSIDGDANMSMLNYTSLYEYSNLSTDHVNLSEGGHNATFYVQDLAGNENSSVVYFSVNFSKPMISITSPLNKSYSTGILSFNMSITNSVVLTEAKVNVNGYNYNWTMANSSLWDWYNITVEELYEGSHNATFYAISTLNSSATRYFTVDTTPPTITITSPQNITYNASSVTLKYSVVEINPDWVGYNLDGRGNKTLTGNTTLYTLYNLVNGGHNLTIYANDTAGNLNSSTVYFTINSTMVARYENSSVVLKAGEITAIYDPDTNTGLEILAIANVTGGVNITLYSEAPGNVLNETYGLASGEYRTGKCIRINVSDNIQGNLSWARVKIYYNASDIDRDGDGVYNKIGVDIDPRTLKIYWYNASGDQKWYVLTRGKNYTSYGPYVYNVGVNQTQPTNYSGYVWANVSRFSIYDISGSLITLSPRAPDEGGVSITPTPIFLRQAFTTLSSSIMNNVILHRNLRYKQFYSMLPMSLAAPLIMLDEYPVPKDISDIFLENPVKPLIGDIYELSAAKVLDKYRSSTAIVIARGDLPVDSMAAIAYARANNLPILLTKPKELPRVTLNAIVKLNPSKIIIVGGPVAVSKSVEIKLANIATIKRKAGETRYETAIELAKTIKNPRLIVITQGHDPVIDAMIISAVYEAPLIYVSEEEIPQAVRDYLADHKNAKVLFVGVNEGVAEKVKRVLTTPEIISPISIIETVPEAVQYQPPVTLPYKSVVIPAFGTTILKITSNNIANLVIQFKYMTLPFFVVKAELAGVLGALDMVPITQEFASVVSKETFKPVETLEGDVYNLTSVQVLKRYDRAEKVIIARGDLGVDSMASVAYARALGVPILLVEPDSIPEVIQDTLEKLGVKSTIIIGRQKAVSRGVEEKLPNATRIGGRDRFDTAVKLAWALVREKKGKVYTIVVTDGRDPDITAVMIAAKYGAPIVYTDGDKVPEKVKEFIDKRAKRNKQLILVGVSEEAREILTTPDETPPTITITNPVEGSTISPVNNTITGRIGDESAIDIVTLRLNDQLVARWRKKGEFSKVVNYTTDVWGKRAITNRITIIATDAYGNSDTREIRVDVLPS